MTQQDTLTARLRARTVEKRLPGTFFSTTEPDPDCAEAAARIETLERQRDADAARIAELEELLAPMAACGRRIPAHAWNDDWYMLDGQDDEGQPFDKVEQKFLCDLLRRAARALTTKG